MRHVLGLEARENVSRKKRDLSLYHVYYAVVESSYPPGSLSAT